MIKYILFDLDDTLFDFQKAERLALSRTLKELGIEPEEKILRRYNELNLAQWKRLERGELTLDQVKTERYRLLFGELGIEESPKKATAIYEKLLSTGQFFHRGSAGTAGDAGAPLSSLPGVQRDASCAARTSGQFGD